MIQTIVKSPSRQALLASGAAVVGFACVQLFNFDHSGTGPVAGGALIAFFVLAASYVPIEPDRSDDAYIGSADPRPVSGLRVEDFRGDEISEQSQRAMPVIY